VRFIFRDRPLFLSISPWTQPNHW